MALNPIMMDKYMEIVHRRSSNLEYVLYILQEERVGERSGGGGGEGRENTHHTQIIGLMEKTITTPTPRAEDQKSQVQDNT